MWTVRLGLGGRGGKRLLFGFLLEILEQRSAERIRARGEGTKIMVSVKRCVLYCQMQYVAICTILANAIMNLAMCKVVMMVSHV